MNKINSFVTKNIDALSILFLGLLLYFIFFHNIGTYALMDVDESRYVSMSKDMFLSKDFMTLYLNGEYFFEKPPLYFWLECLSFAVFGKINEFTARFPVALCGVLNCLMTYFLCKKVHSRFYGFVSALILATSLEFLILAKFAILDIVLTTCVWLSIGFGIFALLSDNKNEKYYYWLFYIFSGLAVMAKGIPGFVVPIGSVFLISIVLKKIKKFFAPLHFIVGILLFLIITLPWHLLMLQLHNPLFFDEYIIKHHIARFLGEGGINREQPFYFYIITLIWGFFPWILSFCSVLIQKLLTKNKKLNLSENLKNFLVCNLVIVLFVMLFFSSSKTKLITYILPIYPALSCIAGYIWVKYIKESENSNIINTTVKVLGSIFILASLVAIFCQLFLPNQLYLDILPAKTFCITLLFATGFASIMFAQRKIYLGVFASYVFLMLSLSAFGTGMFFNIDYKFGQDDLMKFAKYAKEHDKKITTYKFGFKYSLIFYGDKHVDYGLFYSVNELKEALSKPDNLVIIPYKFIDKDVEALNYKILDKGRKYILVVGKKG